MPTMLMRIVAGKYKGKRLKVPKKGVRPTRAIVREAIFDVIGSKIKASSVIDIFAGSGALGLEALSRGAEHCTFVEHQPAILLENISALRERGSSQVFRTDFRAALSKVRKQKYDVIFLDPPYRKNLVEKSLFLICKYALLHDRGIIVVEHAPNELYEIPKDLTVLKRKNYGDTTVSFLVEEKSEDT